MLARVRPRDLVGRTVRRLAADQLADLVRLDARPKALKAELTEAVRASGAHMMDLHGIGPAGAARILADVGDVRRFPDRNHFASWTGTAPLDASSGAQIRHRLSRAGYRRLNHVLYIAAFVQLRHDTAGRAYCRRKLAAGKTPMEAMRCLKGRLSDAVYRQLLADNQHDAASQPNETPLEAGPGGHSGATLTSSAADLTPHIGTFGSATTRVRTSGATRPTTDPTPLPGLPDTTLLTPDPREGSHERACGDREGHGLVRRLVSRTCGSSGDPRVIRRGRVP
ncbi:MAG TPA: transposase, partial [Lapillicoccus sp.]